MCDELKKKYDIKLVTRTSTMIVKEIKRLVRFPVILMFYFIISVPIARGGLLNTLNGKTKKQKTIGLI